MSALEQNYADAVFALQDDGVSDQDIVKGLARMLVARGHQRIAPRILAMLRAKQSERDRTSAVTVTVARTEDATRYAEEIAQSLDDIGVTSIGSTPDVDTQILGGYVVRGAGKVCDASHRSALITLYKNITATQTN